MFLCRSNTSLTKSSKHFGHHIGNCLNFWRRLHFDCGSSILYFACYAYTVATSVKVEVSFRASITRDVEAKAIVVLEFLAEKHADMVFCTRVV